MANDISNIDLNIYSRSLLKQMVTGRLSILQDFRVDVDTGTRAGGLALGCIEALDGPSTRRGSKRQYQNPKAQNGNKTPYMIWEVAKIMVPFWVA